MTRTQTVPMKLAWFAATLTLLAPFAQNSAVAQVRFHGEASGASVKVLSWRDIPFRTVVRQEHDFSCGSAALATLLTYHYGRPTTEAEAFKEMFAAGDQAKIQKVGFSLLDMKTFLEHRGVSADGFRIDLDGLAADGRPVIALIDLGAYRHFVVIKGITTDQVLVGDPAAGLKTYSRAQFKKIWSGVSFAIHDKAMPKPAVFNAAAEWRPWAVAPVGDYDPTQPLGRPMADLPLYQISAAQPSLADITAGVRP